MKKMDELPFIPFVVGETSEIFGHLLSALVSSRMHIVFRDDETGEGGGGCCRGERESARSVCSATISKG